MTFVIEVGAPARLSGGPSTATNIPVVHTLLPLLFSRMKSEREQTLVTVGVIALGPSAI